MINTGKQQPQIRSAIPMNIKFTEKSHWLTTEGLKINSGLRRQKKWMGKKSSSNVSEQCWCHKKFNQNIRFKWYQLHES